jgi:hypothetical protein
LGIAVTATAVFVAAGPEGLQVLARSGGPAAAAGLLQAGSVPIDGHAWDVMLGGRYAYVADQDGALHIFDIGVPLKPRLVARYAATGPVLGFAFRGDLVFIAAGPSGLKVVDIADPTAPTQIGELTLPGVAVDVVLDAGTSAYVVAGRDGLMKVDVTVPTAPRLVGTFPLPGLAERATMQGELIYAASEEGGLLVIESR